MDEYIFYEKQHLVDVLFQLGLSVQFFDPFPHLLSRNMLVLLGTDASKTHSLTELTEKSNNGVGHLPLDIDDDVFAFDEDIFKEDEVGLIEHFALEEQVHLLGYSQQVVFGLLVFDGDVLDQTIEFIGLQKPEGDVFDIDGHLYFPEQCQVDLYSLG